MAITLRTSSTINTAMTRATARFSEHKYGRRKITRNDEKDCKNRRQSYSSYGDNYKVMGIRKTRKDELNSSSKAF